MSTTKAPFKPLDLKQCMEDIRAKAAEILEARAAKAQGSKSHTA